MKILVNEKISQHKYKTPEGYLICVDSVLARTGPQTYRKNELFVDAEDDSEIEVGRSPDEVFAPETLASFENKPITIEHPHEDVNIENYKDYAVGFVRDVKQGKFDGQDVILGTLVITDKDAIEGIENGEHVELSCGYDCDIEDGDDGYQQKHIRGNHVALCEAGRAGVAKIVDSVEDDYNYDIETNFDKILYDLTANNIDYSSAAYDTQLIWFKDDTEYEKAKKYLDRKRWKYKEGVNKKGVKYFEIKDTVKDKDYGGAFDLNPESYFSRDDLIDFEDELERKLGHKARTRAYVDETTLSVDYEMDGESFGRPAEVKIDMRKIKRPRDLIKNYLEPIRKIIEKEYKESFGDSITDAKKYAVEFMYGGDSWSRYLGQVWVYANSEKEALKKAEEYAANHRPYWDNYVYGSGKIVPKAYSNSPVIDAIEDAVVPEAKGQYKGYTVIAKHVGYKNAPTLVELYDGNKKVHAEFSAEEDLDDAIKAARYYWPELPLTKDNRKFIQNYLSMISTFTSRDTDIKDVLRPLSGKGFKYTIDKIEGWIWKKGEMAYKNYYISLDGYKDKFMVTLYADPDKDWKVNEVNAYFTDSKTPDEEQTMLEKDSVKDLKRFKIEYFTKNDDYRGDIVLAKNAEEAVSKIKKALPVYRIIRTVEINDETPDEEQTKKLEEDLEMHDVDPRSGESKDDFIARFMSETKSEYPDEKQRLAVAFSYWKKAHGKDSKVRDYKWKITYPKGKPGKKEEIIEANNYREAEAYAAKQAHGWGFGIERIEDTQPKDSIYTLNIVGQKSKKLVQAKDAREAVEKYKKMFPKDKVKSVKRADKFNKIIENIPR